MRHATPRGTAAVLAAITRGGARKRPLGNREEEERAAAATRRALVSSAHGAHGGEPVKMVHWFLAASLHAIALPAGPGSLKQTSISGLQRGCASHAGLLLNASIASMQLTVMPLTMAVVLPAAQAALQADNVSKIDTPEQSALPLVITQFNAAAVSWLTNCVIPPP